MAVVLELALDAEEVLLGVVDEDQPPRRDARDLAAQLGADRAAGAGDHDHLAAEVARRRGRAPCARARGRGCPRPARRAPGARPCPSRPAAARRPSAACAPGCRAGAPPRTTRARSVPGADGIAIVISSGSASSRMRAELGRSRPSTLDAVDADAALERVVVDEADRARGRAAGCAGSRAATSRPPSPAPTISTRRASRARRGSRAAGARRRSARRSARRRRRPA